MSDHPYKRLTLFSVILISFFNPFMGAAVNLALPAISSEFAMSGSAFLCTLAQSADWLIIFRFLQGSGGALVFGTGMALIYGLAFGHDDRSLNHTDPYGFSFIGSRIGRSAPLWPLRKTESLSRIFHATLPEQSGLCLL